VDCLACSPWSGTSGVICGDESIVDKDGEVREMCYCQVLCYWMREGDVFLTMSNNTTYSRVVKKGRGEMTDDGWKFLSEVSLGSFERTTKEKNWKLKLRDLLKIIARTLSRLKAT